MIFWSTGAMVSVSAFYIAVVGGQADGCGFESRVDLLRCLFFSNLFLARYLKKT